MRVLVGTVFLLALAGTAVAQQEDTIFPFDYRVVELENGFKAYLINAGAPGQIAYVSMVRTGSRDEVEEGKTGFAHFFEHVMFRGTEKYPDFDSVTASMGAARNAFTSNDMTVYYEVAPSEYLATLVDLESDRFMNLSYPESDFRTEAGAVLGEYQQGARSPFRYLSEAVRTTAYDAHTYRHTTIGFEADVRAMPEGYEYSLSFHRRFYRPENVVLVLVGDYDYREAERLITEYYSQWETGYEAPDIPIEPEQTRARRRTVQYPGRTLPVLSINYKAPAWSASDRNAVALQVLGRVAFGSTSDLYKELVVQDRQVQYLNAGFGLARDPGLVSITTMVMNPRGVEAVEGRILETVGQFKTDLVEEQVLADTKSNMKYGFLMGLETAQQIAFSMIGYVIRTGGIEAVEDYYRTLDAVTAEDVRAAAQQWLIESGKTTVTMVQRRGR
jgi:zinc protease